MRTYDTYKDSGISWLGQIPSHWKITSLRQFLIPFSLKGFPDKQLLSVTRELGVIIRDMSRESNHNVIPEDLSGYKVVKPGQFVINKMKSWQGSYGVSNYEGIVSPAYFVYDLNIANKEFFSMALRSRAYVPFFMQYSKGIRVDQWDLSPIALKSIPFMLPTPKEQEAIVAFLNDATASIDSAIEQQRKMIELLRERKQIIIEAAVTKGIDSNVEFKDSGLNYLGLIPNNWGTIRLGYCSWIRARLGWKGLTADEYVDEGYPFLSAFNIINNLLVWSPLNFINKYRFDESPEIKLKIGDILLVKDGAGIGKCARVDDLPCGEATANGSLAFITPDDTFDYRYLYYFFISNCFKQYTELLINGQGVPHLTQEVLKRVKVPRPPKGIQVSIAEQLDKSVSKINASIASCDKIIDKLQERKQILINDVVTGKIKII